MKYTGFYTVELLNVDTLKSGHPPAKLISTYLLRASQLYFILAKLLGFTLGNREGISTYIAQGMGVCCSAVYVCNLHRSG